MGTVVSRSARQGARGQNTLLVSAETAGHLLVPAVPGSACAMVPLSPSPNRLLFRQSRVSALQPASYAHSTAHRPRDPDSALARAGLSEPVCADAGRSLCHEPPSAAEVRRHTAAPHSHQCATRVWGGHPGACPGFVSPRRRGAGSLHASGCAAGDPDLCFHAVASRPALETQIRITSGTTGSM